MRGPRRYERLVEQRGDVGRDRAIAGPRRRVGEHDLIGPALEGSGTRPRAPLLIKMLQWPVLRRIPGRVLALGIRPEHIRTLDVMAGRDAQP